MLLADMRSSEGGTFGQFFFHRGESHMGSLSRRFVLGLNALSAAIQMAGHRGLVQESSQRHRNKGPSGNAVSLSHGAKVGGWEPRLGEPATVNYGLRKPCKCGSGKKYKRCCLVKDLAEIEAQRLAARPSMPEAVKTGRTLGGDDAGLDEGCVSDGGDCESVECLAEGGQQLVRCGEAGVVQTADGIEARTPSSDQSVPVEVLSGAGIAD